MYYGPHAQAPGGIPDRVVIGTCFVCGFLATLAWFMLPNSPREMKIAQRTEQCLRIWSPRDAYFEPGVGCVVSIRGEWWPAKNIAYRQE